MSKIKTLAAGLLSLAMIVSFQNVASYLPQADGPTSLLFLDRFDNLSNWTITTSGSATATLNSAISYGPAPGLAIRGTGGGKANLVRDFPQLIQGRLRVWFYDDMSATKGSMVGVQDPVLGLGAYLGVYTPKHPNTYFMRTDSSNSRGVFQNTYIKRAPGWHVFEIIVSPKGTFGMIDGNNLAYLSVKKATASDPTAYNPVNLEMKGFTRVTIASPWFIPGDSFFDALRITTLPPTLDRLEDRELLPILRYFQAYWNESTDLDDSYFNGQLTFRPNRLLANEALMAAILYKKGYGPQYLERAKTILAELVTHPPTMPPIFTTPMTYSNAALAAWMIWTDLNFISQNSNRNFQVDIKNYLSYHADYWSRQTPGVGYIGDTAGESNAWTAAFLAVVSQMFSSSPQSPMWANAAKIYGFHSFTVGELYQNIRTQTLYPDYTMANHNMRPHPSYTFAATMGSLGEAALVYIKQGKAVPSEFSHNVLNVWGANKQLIGGPQFLFQNCELATMFGGKDDWGWDGSSSTVAFAFLDYLQGSHLHSDLTDFQSTVQDVSTYFPAKGNSPPFGTPPNTTEMDVVMRRFLNSVYAQRRAVGLLYADPTFNLVPVN